MPTYQYQCTECEKPVERNVPMAERDGQHCEHCGAKLFKKIVFTGSTWSPTRNGGFS